jgi:hypothetical protein
VQRVVDTFGADAVLAYGAWSSWQGMRAGLPSSPTDSLRRRRLAQRLTVVWTPARYATTKTCSPCHGPAAPDPQRTRAVDTTQPPPLPALGEQRGTVATTLSPTRGSDRCQASAAATALHAEAIAAGIATTTPPSTFARISYIFCSTAPGTLASLLPPSQSLDLLLLLLLLVLRMLIDVAPSSLSTLSRFASAEAAPEIAIPNAGV